MCRPYNRYNIFHMIIVKYKMKIKIIFFLIERSNIRFFYDCVSNNLEITMYKKILFILRVDNKHFRYIIYLWEPEPNQAKINIAAK